MMRVFTGIAASPGYAVGAVHRVRRISVSAPRREISAEEIPEEQERFKRAVERSRAQLTELVGKLEREVGLEEAQILSSQLLMLEDEMIIDATHRLVAERLVNAEAAFGGAIADIVVQFHAIPEKTFRERIADLRDLEQRVLLAFDHAARARVAPPPQPAIVAARNLTPSETAALGRENVLGFAIDEGASTSHVAILARSLGVPAVLGLDGVAADLSDGDLVALDGANGQLIVAPDAETAARIRSLDQQAITVRRKLDYLRDLPAVTPDGHRVQMLANIELPVEVDEALAHGAEGVGLLRTEYLYFQHGDIPDETTQVAMYVGGDKVSGYLGAKREYNPFLGWRGIRYSLTNRGLFKRQIRAIYRAAAVGPAQLMFPMITGVEELRAALDICVECRFELERDGFPFSAELPIGVMIETPAAAAIADLLAAECDFFSLGTNDLIQYTLAMDRGNSRVAYLYRPLHPAILRIMRQVVAAGHEAGIAVGLCGELGSETRLAEVLLGVGFDEISLHAPALPKVKQVIRWTDYKEAQRLVEELCLLTTAAEADAYLARYIAARKRDRAQQKDV
jgi:phosphotransferase system enzyme I (PtsI)